MKKNWLWLLASGLAACGGPVQVAPDVALRHQHDAALQQQVQQLPASQLKLTATLASAKSPAMLNLEVIGPRDQPSQPDTLRQRVRRLARVVALDLAQPEKYQVLSVRVVSRKSPFDASSTSLSFIYPLASLR